MKKFGILFDLDGTLIDSAPDVCLALNNALATIDRRPHTVEETKQYLGWGAKILMTHALEATGGVDNEEMVDKLTKLFLDDYAANPVINSTLYPGIIEALDTLTGRGANLAICTNKPSKTTDPVLDYFGLGKYFQAIICADMVKKRKPDGGHIHDTVTAMSGSPEKIIMIGDSESDIDAAIDAKVPSIAVTFGYAHKPHHELGANIVIDHFDQLMASINSIYPH